MSVALLYSYADALWLLVMLLFLHKGQRLIACAFVLSGMFMMRLQIELFEVISYPRGILNILDNSLFERGLLTYSVFYLLYTLLMYFSRGSMQMVKISASISIFFMALVVSTAMMAL